MMDPSVGGWIHPVWFHFLCGPSPCLPGGKEAPKCSGSGGPSDLQLHQAWKTSRTIGIEIGCLASTVLVMGNYSHGRLAIAYSCRVSTISPSSINSHGRQNLSEYVRRLVHATPLNPILSSSSKTGWMGSSKVGGTRRPQVHSVQHIKHQLPHSSDQPITPLIKGPS